MTRGSVWWVDFGEPTGSEPAFIRPAVVISADPFNRSGIRTVVVAAITSNLRLGEAPANVVLEEADAGLRRSSAINVTQLATIDRTNLRERIGNLPPSRMIVLDDGLRQSLGL